MTTVFSREIPVVVRKALSLFASWICIGAIAIAIWVTIRFVWG